MKDQFKLLRTCIHNDIPAIVFQGDDECAVEILEASIEIYRKHGCSMEFLYDLQLLIDDFKAYRKECPDRIKLPNVSPTEAELIREEMKQKI